MLGLCERLWQLRLRGVRQLQERALVQLQAESRGLGTQQLQAWLSGGSKGLSGAQWTRSILYSQPTWFILLSRMTSLGRPF